MDDMIKILADGTLDDMRKALSGLDVAQLAALKAAEEAGKKRSGAIEMIDDALAALDTGDTQDDAGAPPPPPAPETQPPVPPASPPPPPPPPAPETAKKGPVRLVVPSDRGALIARLARALADGDAVAIVFADAQGEVLPVPPIEAKAADFQRFGGEFPKLIYTPRIALPMTLPRVAVRQLFLLVEPEMGEDGPPAVAVCRLTGDLFAGGGQRAEIPDGNLLFSLN